MWKLPGHLEKYHKKEAKVKQFRRLKKGSAKRKEIISKLRNLGNHKHNTEIMAKGSGPLKVARWSEGATEYVPCHKCHRGPFSSKQFSRHKCVAKKPPRVNVARQMAAIETHKVSQGMAKMFWGKADHKYGAVKEDPLVMEIVEEKIQKMNGKKVREFRHNLRLLNGFLLECRKLIDGALGLKDILKTENLEMMREAARNCAQEYELPHSAYKKLRRIVNNVLKFKKLRSNSEDEKKDAKVLLKKVQENSLDWRGR